ncbi:MAG: PDZ domain-containing protein [Rhodospirillales bacterium]
MIFHKTSAVLAALVLAAGVSVSAPAPARAESGFTGMQIQGMDPLFANALGMPAAAGVLIRDIALGGPADLAGLRRGDLIIGFDGEPVRTVGNLASMASQTEPGGSYVITVRREGGAETEITITMGVWPAAWQLKEQALQTLEDHGLTMTALTQQMRNNLRVHWGTSGVGVTVVGDPSEPGYKTDLQRGEVIIQVNQKDVWLPEHVIEAYEKAKAAKRKAVMLTVKGAAGYRFSVLTVQQ